MARPNEAQCRGTSNDRCALFVQKNSSGSGFDAPMKTLQRPLRMKSVKIPALELFLHEMIPLAKAMGVGVEVSDDRALTLRAPKEQNKNSLNTAFGGSLVSLATLAGYGVVWELMKNEKGADKTEWRIVVKESRAAYRKPVLGDLRAICERPAHAAISEFKEALARYGKAKLKLKASIVENGQTAVDVTAAFVVGKRGDRGMCRFASTGAKFWISQRSRGKRTQSASLLLRTHTICATGVVTKPRPASVRVARRPDDRGSDVLRVRLVLLHVAGFLALVVDGVFLEVGLVNIVRRHPERLRERDEEVEEIHDLDLGVLLVEFLVLRPPFPRHAVDQLGRFLLHGAGVIEDPLRLFLVRRRREIDADPRLNASCMRKISSSLSMVADAANRSPALASPRCTVKHLCGRTEFAVAPSGGNRGI